MPYRQGLDRGDIPRGGFLGSIVHAIGGGIKGFITGGPAGAIGGAAGAAIKYNLNSGAANPIGSLPPPNQTPEALSTAHAVSIHKAQAAGKLQGRPGAGAVLTSGSTAMTIHKQLGGGMGSGRRTMRVTNVKALRRAIRRATGFAKLAMKTIKIVHPQKKGKFGGFKRKKGR